MAHSPWHFSFILFLILILLFFGDGIYYCPSK